ncbi:MAG: hypothetical protein HYV07_21520 [Deltaproteobacteria bacterium]|nr:hypothetical protein [Deltaproteobacteria bacterium]
MPRYPVEAYLRLVKSVATAVRIEVRAVVFQEGPFLVVQCLEHDIAAQGATLAEALRSFFVTLEANIRVDLENGEVPLVRLAPAPDGYHRMFDEARFRSSAPEGHEAITPAWMINTVAKEVRIWSR